MILHLALVGLGTLLAAALVTGWVRNYALRRKLLDVPNDRSSHVVPTPRGGGLAIVAALVSALVISRSLDWVSADLFIALSGGGLLVALIGWIDDHRSISAVTRLLAHFTAALWAVYWVGGLSTVRLGTVELQLGPAGGVLAVLALVWLLNLYNFMDGIDGLAALEGLMVGIGGAILSALAGSTNIAVVSLLIGCASGGFLAWNWAPARIFMGDIGSGFLGYVLAVTALASERTGGPPLILWLLLLGVFVMDATVTLVRRAVSREQLSTAHRRHAYQRAVQAGLSHADVAAIAALINLVLLGLALAALLKTGMIWLVSLTACTVLLTAYWAVERRRPMYDGNGGTPGTAS